MAAVLARERVRGRRGGDEGESPVDGRQGGRGRDRSDQRGRRTQAGRRLHRPVAMSTRSCSGQSGSFRPSYDRSAGRATAAVPTGSSWSTNPSAPPVSTWCGLPAGGCAVSVGHAGTLDPFATGLLLVMIGSATRVSSLAHGIAQGVRPAGAVRRRFLDGRPDRSDRPFRGATGSVAMTVTAHGSRGGSSTGSEAGSPSGSRSPPLSRWTARPSTRKPTEGRPRRPPSGRSWFTTSVWSNSTRTAQTARLLALTGSGTYARVLAIDIGEALGCGGYAAAPAADSHRDVLGGRRAVAPRTSVACNATRKGAAGVLSLDEALAFIPARELSDTDARLAANGNELRDVPAGRFRVSRGRSSARSLRGDRGARAAAGRLSGGRLTMRDLSLSDGGGPTGEPAEWSPSACSTACIVATRRSCAGLSMLRERREPRPPL